MRFISSAGHYIDRAATVRERFPRTGTLFENRDFFLRSMINFRLSLCVSVAALAIGLPVSKLPAGNVDSLLTADLTRTVLNFTGNTDLVQGREYSVAIDLSAWPGGQVEVWVTFPPIAFGTEQPSRITRISGNVSTAGGLHNLRRIVVTQQVTPLRGIQVIRP